MILGLFFSAQITPKIFLLRIVLNSQHILLKKNASETLATTGKITSLIFDTRIPAKHESLLKRLKMPSMAICLFLPKTSFFLCLHNKNLVSKTPQKIKFAIVKNLTLPLWRTKKTRHEKCNFRVHQLAQIETRLLVKNPKMGGSEK
jgi:hypothetical protein